MKVSIIIPVYNEEAKIKGCLDSLFKQTYKDFEVLIINDDSTDRTLEIVKKYDVKVFKNGKKNYEIGKAIGICNAGGEYLFFIDADNRLIDKEWLSKAVKALENKEVVGVQSWKFFYSKNHSLANRYHELFGNADPSVFYLKSQDHLQNWKKKWDLAGKIVEDKKDYIFVKFKKNEVPTIGSQGFLTRKEYFKGAKVFQHIEYARKLSEKGVFCFLKNEVEHLAFKDVKNIINKLSRNLDYALEDMKKKEFKRYALNLGKMIRIFFMMSTLVIPFYDSFKGYIHIRDNAWFLHIFLSFIIPWIYAWQFIKFKFKSIISW